MVHDSSDRSWSQEVAALADTLSSMSRSQRYGFPEEVANLKKMLLPLDKDIVRQLPQFMESIPMEERDFNFVSVHVLESENTTEKLKAVYRHALYVMGKHEVSFNTAVFLVTDIVRDQPLPGDELTVEQERLILEVHTSLLAVAERGLRHELHSVVLKYPQHSERIIGLLAEREFLMNPTDLEGLLNEDVTFPMHEGVL